MDSVRKALIVGAILGALACLVATLSCAHVTSVGKACAGDTVPLITPVAEALAQQDYEVAIIKATVGVAPCLVAATVREIVESLDRNSQVKASMALDADVVRRHAHEWLSTRSAE